MKIIWRTWPERAGRHIGNYRIKKFTKSETWRGLIRQLPRDLAFPSSMFSKSGLGRKENSPQQEARNSKTAYSPTTTNRSGEIYAELGVIPAAKAKAAGIVGAAQIGAQQRQQSAANWAQGISSLGSSLGGGISKAFSQINQNNLQRDYMTAGMQGMMERGIVSPETYQKFSGASLGAQSGMFAQAQSVWDAYMKSQEGEDTLNRQIRLKQEEHNIDTRDLGKTTWAYDEQTKQWKPQYVQTSAGAISPVGRAENIPTQPAPIPVLSGGQQVFLQSVYDQGKQAWVYPPTLPNGASYTPLQGSTSSPGGMPWPR